MSTKSENSKSKIKTDILENFEICPAAYYRRRAHAALVGRLHALAWIVCVELWNRMFQKFLTSKMLLKKNKEKNIFLHPYSSCKKFQNRDRIGFKQRVLTIQIRNGENCEKGTAILKNLLINAVAENEKKDDDVIWLPVGSCSFYFWQWKVIVKSKKV